jgi:cytochrome P450
VTTTNVQPEQLADPDFHAGGDAHELWRRMRETDPVYRHEPGELPAFWSVTRYADVRAVYSDPPTFSSAYGVLLRPVARGEDPGSGLTLALTDPPRHRLLRGLVAEPFNVRSARTLADTMRAEVRDVLARALQQGTCDFAQDVAARLSIFSICRVLGVPSADFELVFGWTQEAFAAHKPLAAHVPIMRYFIDLMDASRGAPADDVAGRIVHGAIDGEPLSEAEILLNLENLVGATENAGLSMASGILAFLEHPDEWRRLREDRRLLATAVEEALRWTSSATHSMRTATRACAVGEATIAPGDRVVLWLPSANRDAAAFDDPDRFDVGRRPNRHLALGFGEHVCIGGSMARAQFAILLTELLDSVAVMEQAGPVVPLRSIAVNGPEHLPVRLTPR